MFNSDSKRVLAILKDLCLNTGAETWFRNITCGRKAMKALQTHYDGPDERHKRIEEARAKISQAFYKHEGTFTKSKPTVPITSQIIWNKRGSIVTRGHKQ